MIGNNTLMEDREQVEICQLHLFRETWWNKILVKNITSLTLQFFHWNIFPEIIRKLKKKKTKTFRGSLTGCSMLLCILMLPKYADSRQQTMPQVLGYLPQKTTSCIAVESQTFFIARPQESGSYYNFRLPRTESWLSLWKWKSPRAYTTQYRLLP